MSPINVHRGGTRGGREVGAVLQRGFLVNDPPLAPRILKLGKLRDNCPRDILGKPGVLRCPLGVDRRCREAEPPSVLGVSKRVPVRCTSAPAPGRNSPHATIRTWAEYLGNRVPFCMVNSRRWLAVAGVSLARDYGPRRVVKSRRSSPMQSACRTPLRCRSAPQEVTPGPRAAHASKVRRMARRPWRNGGCAGPGLAESGQPPALVCIQGTW